MPLVARDQPNGFRLTPHAVRKPVHPFSRHPCRTAGTAASKHAGGNCYSIGSWIYPPCVYPIFKEDLDCSYIRLNYLRFQPGNNTFAIVYKSQSFPFFILFSGYPKFSIQEINHINNRYPIINARVKLSSLFSLGIKIHRYN